MSARIDSTKIQKIKDLRQKGYSLPDISKQLTIAKTTVFRHTRKVEILPEFISVWEAKRGGSRLRKTRLDSEADQEAKHFVNKLSKREKLLFLSALYWAEGNKKDLILTNTDANLVKVFMNAARETLGVTEDRFHISIRLYEDLSREKSLLFWSEVTKIPKEKFISVHILPGKKKGKLEFGMCRVRITKGVLILKKINAINKFIAELISKD